MPPIQNNQQTVTNPTSLPPVQVADPQLSATAQQAMQSPGLQSQPAQPAPSVTAQVKAIIAKYRTNPFQLNAAFQQLKSDYLKERYDIDPSEAKK